MKRLTAFIFLFQFSLLVNAQQQIVASGGNAAGSGGSTSFSIGQIDFISLSNTTNSGVQQSFDNSISLPVTGLLLTAAKKGKEVLLKWETISEYNSSHFIVQHSSDSNPVFDSIGRISSSGNSNAASKYSLLDKTPSKGNNYYRIKQVDKDGKFIYSSTVVVNFESDIVVSCYPNPTSSSIKLDIGRTDLNGCFYQLFDPNGKLIATSIIFNQVTIVNMEALKPAAYIIKIQNIKAEPVSIFVIKR